MNARDAPKLRMSKYTLYVSSSMSSLGSAGGSQVMRTLSFVKGSTGGELAVELLLHSVELLVEHDIEMHCLVVNAPLDHLWGWG